VNTTAERGFAADYALVPEDVWRRTQLLYVCSPGNPTGKGAGLAEWKKFSRLPIAMDSSLRQTSAIPRSISTKPRRRLEPFRRLRGWVADSSDW